MARASAIVIARRRCIASETIKAVFARMTSMIASASTKFVHVEVERVSQRIASGGTPSLRA